MTLTPDQIAKIQERYEPLYSSITTKTDGAEPLLLAHYTSVQVIEQILKKDEIWFGNPLYMNDLGEMRSGLLLGSQVFPEFAKLAAGTDERAARLIQTYNFFVAHLATQTALDIYVFCLSEHPHDDKDGRLSMWREYGSKGNGAALVFNAQRIDYQPHNPIIIAKVAYKDDSQRVEALRADLGRWAEITQKSDLPDDQLGEAARAAFGFVKSVALTTKHKGFEEEKEWRAVYVPERDPLGYLKSCLGYFVGPRGLEPKLKYRFGELDSPDPPKKGAAPLNSGASTDIIEFFLLGPSASSPLAKAAFHRMLEHNGKSVFAAEERVFSSTIPLRPTL